jgi:hypothetical protein
MTMMMIDDDNKSKATPVHAVETHGGKKGTAPLILNFGAR